MNLFRNLLFWIVLALVGALAAQLLVQDPGVLTLDFRGTRYVTTLAAAILVGLGVWVALWLIWKMLTLPFVTLRRRRNRAARMKLVDGLGALELGQWGRSEKLLDDAARQPMALRQGVAHLAHAGAARAAAAAGDAPLARQHLDALTGSHPVTRAVIGAELALADGRPAEALMLLETPDVQPLPPRGLLLRAHALAATGEVGEAYGLLGAMRQQKVLPVQQLDRLEAQWASAALREAGDANILADRWESLPKAFRTDPVAVTAYAERAAALRWEDAAAKSVEKALDERWDESLAALYGRLPIGQLERRRENAERWLQAHPGSPALLLALARINRVQGQWGQAEGYLHRAIAQGAGGDAWEELGHGFAESGDEPRSRLAYANALRASRGEAVTELPGRDMRQQLHDMAVVEERDEHGMPRLRE